MGAYGRGIELIRAKTLVPPPRRSVIARTELLSRLTGAEGKPLVLVRAPAGYGKTTVLSQWAQAETARRFAWVSLDSTDNDPVMFWRYVLSAMRSCDAGFANAAWESLAGPAPQLEDTVLPDILNGLVSLGPSLAVILDDYHRVENTRVHDTVTMFIDYLPRSTQLVISSRTTPPLSLARLQARGLIETVGPADLAFSIEETARVVAGLGSDFTGNDALEIHRLTEGWAAGVYLSAATHRPNRQRLSDEAAANATSDYLVQELLGTVPDEDRNFLLETSILDRMNGELCDFVTGGTHSTQRLAAGVHENLMVIPLDGEGGWYRYHHMFQDALRAELVRTRLSGVAALHIRAHDWFVKHGFVSEAIDHALASGNVEAAAELVCRHTWGYIMMGRLETVREWLRRFGEESRRAYPPLLVASAYAAAFSGDAQNARRFATLAAEATYDGPTPDGMSSFEVSVAVLFSAIGLDGITETRRQSSIARRLEPLESPWRPLIECQFGVSSTALGDVEAAEDAFTRSLQLTGGNDALAAYVLAQLAFVATLRGKWDEAARTASRAVDLIEELHIENLASSCSAYAISASIALNRDRVVDAKRYLKTATNLEHLLSDAIAFEAFQTHLVLGEVHVALEDYASAQFHSRAASSCLAVIGDVGILDARLEALDALLDDQDLEAPAPQPGPESLTTRERQILHLMASSKSLREIGHELFVSRNTVKTHASRIYKKLGVSSREEAVTRAVELHLI